MASTGLLACFALTLAAPAPAIVPPGGVKGVVLDSSCYGPCSINDDPRPYQGEGLRIVIRHHRSGDVAARLAPANARFQRALASGVYRVRAFVRAPGRMGSSCWDDEVKRVRVVDGTFSRLRLHVTNTCIV